MADTSAGLSARQQAEARRAKILAKQRDRLTAIVGPYGSSSGGSSAGASPLPDAARQAAEETVVGAAGASTQASPPPLTPAPELAAGRNEDIAGSAAAQHLEHLLSGLLQAQDQAQAAEQQLQAAADREVQQAAQRGIAPLSDRQPRPRRPQSAGAASASSSSTWLTEESLAASEQAPPSLPVSDVAVNAVWLGRRLGAAAERTRVLRLLTSMLQAYAWCAGFLVSMSSQVPPMLAVICVQLMILAGGMVLVDTSRSATRGAAEAELQASLPARLRQLNVFTFVPGLGELLAALAGYRRLVQAVYDDVAAFLFTCVLLVYTHHTMGL